MSNVTPRVAYVVSRFPKVTETFIAREMLELERLGMYIEIFSIMVEPAALTHPEVEQLHAEVHYGLPPTMALIRSQLGWVRRAPLTYARAWWRAIRGNIRSPHFLIRSLPVVLVGAYFARMVESLAIRHVHAHWATHPALAALVIKDLTGVTFSFTIHAQDLYVNRSMLDQKIAEAEFVVTISEYNKRLLQSLYGGTAGDKVRVVRSGVDTDLFDRRALPRPDPHLFRVICVAALEDYKGHEYLLEACRKLVELGVPLRCTLVGQGADRSKLEGTVSRLGLEDVVNMVGALPSDKVRQLLGTSDLFVLASVSMPNGLQEGLPVALIEALAMQVPVVATEISGIPELVDDHTGILVPERDSTVLAEAMHALYLSPSTRKEMGRAGRRKVLEDYNLSRNVANLYQLLTQSL